jgi:hypothetical protein
MLKDDVTANQKFLGGGVIMIKAFLFTSALCLSIYSILLQKFPEKPAYVGDIYKRIERNAEDIVRLEEATIKTKRNLDEIKRTERNLTKLVNIRKEKAKKVKRK